ncbi:MAG TPA: Ig-like domain-containing protein [Solirubrobacteraceae bacterium]|nr:Ig-like domain-containing protein [Solirubrobacteraceae bacterium]
MNERASVVSAARRGGRVAAFATSVAIASLVQASGAAAAEPTAAIKTFAVQRQLDGPNTCAGCGAAVQLNLEYELEGQGYGATPADPSGGIPPLSAIKLYLPEGLQEHPGGFGECTAATLRNIGPSGCPENASVSPFGSTLQELSFGAERVPEEAELKAFLGEGGLLFYEAGHSPVALEVVWKGRFGSAGLTGFGEELTSELPPVASVPGAPLASTKTIHLKLGSVAEHGEEPTPYLTLPNACPTEGLSFKTELTFGGEPGFGIPAKTVSATSKVPCPKVTTTSLEVSPNTTVTNQNVKLTSGVSITGGGTPEGTVTFTEFGFLPTFGCESQPLSKVGTASLATCETTFDAFFSPEKLGATFESSNEAVQDSKSPVVNLEVGRDSTTTTLAVSNTTPATGTPVTYTATVTPMHPGLEVPSGSVAFLDRGSPMSVCQHRILLEVGSVAKATCTLTYISGGTAFVSASYPGDPNFGGSTSPTQFVFVHSGAGPTSSTPGSTQGPATGTLGSTTAVISRAQIATLLGQELVPSGKAAKIAALLKKGGFSRAIRVLENGTATISWYQVPAGAKIAKKAKPILVAAGRLTFASAGSATIKIRLTKAGKALLKRVKKVALTAKGTFAPAGASPVVVVRRFTLRR